MSRVDRMQEALEALQRAHAFAAAPALDADPNAAVFTTLSDLVGGQHLELAKLSALPEGDPKHVPLDWNFGILVKECRRPRRAAPLMAQMNALQGGGLLAVHARLPAEVAVALAAAGRLVAEAGGALLAGVAERPDSRAALRRMYHGDGAALHNVVVHVLDAARQQEATCGAMGSSAARASLAGALVAPRRMLPFLRAAVDAGPIDFIYFVVTHLLAPLLLHSSYGHLQAAVAADAALVRRLGTLLLQCLAFAAASGGCCGRSDGDASDSAAAAEGQGRHLDLSTWTVAALNSGPLLFWLRGKVEGGNAAALRLLQDTAAVLRQLPTRAPGVPPLVLWEAQSLTARLLGCLLLYVPGRPAGPPFLPPQVARPVLVRQSSRVAVQALPAVCAAAGAIADALPSLEGPLTQVEQQPRGAALVGARAGDPAALQLRNMFTQSTASVECGRADWKEHKKACKLLGAERERRREARREAGDEAAA
ncbi:hypothetical protein C2E20_4312 [Micractinium conductrix]|uniref:Uncharacterized protein n=1 Tax=Micractinium conductrix TaxID=554055 RepID=A0A2P6VEQ3_9CHLO|nr:hypothetical protein C2E20_4312 [Micractinium conductrix]|eukprot:PSC72557.1 hypothetical protein C2E20_4312 [Micractinium conductrix]